MKKQYLYHYTKEETEIAMNSGKCWVCERTLEDDCCKLMMNQYGCDICGGSFDPDYGGKTDVYIWQEVEETLSGKKWTTFHFNPRMKGDGKVCGWCIQGY